MHEISIREIRLHRRPQIRIQAGEFVATFDREDYRLGTPSQGAATFSKIRMEMVS